jgi:hypothetical protein
MIVTTAASLIRSAMFGNTADAREHVESLGAFTHDTALEYLMSLVKPLVAQQWHADTKDYISVLGRSRYPSQSTEFLNASTMEDAVRAFDTFSHFNIGFDLREFYVPFLKRGHGHPLWLEKMQFLFSGVGFTTRPDPSKPRKEGEPRLRIPWVPKNSLMYHFFSSNFDYNLYNEDKDRIQEELNWWLSVVNAVMTDVGGRKEAEGSSVSGSRSGSRSSAGESSKSVSMGLLLSWLHQYAHDMRLNNSMNSRVCAVDKMMNPECYE